MNGLWAAAQRAIESNDQSDGSVWFEVGSYCGRSTALLAGVLAIAGKGILIAVDPMEGNLSKITHWGLNGLLDSNELISMGSTFEKFSATMAKIDTGNVTLVQKRFTDVEIKHPVSLVFIDGLHDYESVKADWEHVKPHLTNGATVAFHDYFQWEGVTKLVDQVIHAGEFVQGSVYTAESLFSFAYQKP